MYEIFGILIIDESDIEIYVKRGSVGDEKKKSKTNLMCNALSDACFYKYSTDASGGVGRGDRDTGQYKDC